MKDFFSWERLFENLPKLLRTLPVTFEIVIIAFSAGLVLAVVLAFVMVRRVPVLRQVNRMFVSFERCTPLLVQLMVVYYGIPLVFSALFGVDTRTWSKLFFVNVAMTLNVGAFLSEVFRAAIEAIPQGQTDAALACGLTSVQSFVRVILPQAFRVALPNIWTFVVSLLKSTSLVYMVGVIDIVGRAQAISSKTGHVLECYVIIALVFIVCSLLIQLPYKAVERRLDFFASGRAGKGGHAL